MLFCRQIIHEVYRIGKRADSHATERLSSKMSIYEVDNDEVV